MEASIIDATGATGKNLLSQLLTDDAYAGVRCFMRKPLALTHPKLHTHTADFDTPEVWADLLYGDVIFSCLGATLAMAGSRDAQWRVGYDYQYAFAKHCRNIGVPTFVLVSAAGTRVRSKLLHNRMRGALEETVKKLNLPHLLVFQPSIPIRSNDDKGGENSTVKAVNFLNKLGLFRRYRPMPTTILAARMQHEASVATKGIHTFTLDKVFF